MAHGYASGINDHHAATAAAAQHALHDALHRGTITSTNNETPAQQQFLPALLQSQLPVLPLFITQLKSPRSRCFSNIVD
jgi:hypothetical protein